MFIFKTATSAGRGHRAATRKLLFATASSVLALTAAPAFAQVQTQPSTDQPALSVDQGAPAPIAAPAGGSNDDAAGPDVIVTGIRGSLQRNLDLKRTSSGVVDVISAEDIGKFPDSNVASALQRLPGVAIQRSGSRGDATGVSIRGFGGDFVRTLYDGRQLSTATGGRGIDFTTVGADFVGRLSVYKTPDVELSTSAIGGTIDISLPKPFDREGFVLAASGSGLDPVARQERASDRRPADCRTPSPTTRSASSARVAYTRRDTESNQVFIPGWIGQQGGGQARASTGASSPHPALRLISTDANRTGTPAWAPQQQGVNQASTQDERIDGRIAVQWRPTDTITADDRRQFQPSDGQEPVVRLRGVVQRQRSAQRQAGLQRHRRRLQPVRHADGLQREPREATSTSRTRSALT